MKSTQSNLSPLKVPFQSAIGAGVFVGTFVGFNFIALVAGAAVGAIALYTKFTD